MLRNILLSLVFTSLIYGQVGQVDYSAVEGKTVRNINITNEDIFTGTNPWLYRQVNNIKVNTRETVVKRELVFKSGDKVTELMVKESARNLRSLRFLDQIRIIPKIDGDYVDFDVIVKETWTLIPQISYSNTSGNQNSSFGIEDSNLLGMAQRFEVLKKEEDNRASIETVWDNRRAFGTNKDIVVGYFNRDDGDRYFLDLENPIRTLLDKHGWEITYDQSDYIGRLFRNGEERFIYGTDFRTLGGQYVYTKGNPDTVLKRYGFGYNYTKNYFREATTEDYEIIDVEKSEMEQDVKLADNRRFSGVTANYSRIKANYIPINYIDRFERYEDYNLGEQLNIKTQYAPEFLGSLGDSFLNSSSVTKGWSFGNLNFIRSEARLGNRIEADGIKNTLFSIDLKYYKILGRKFLFGRSVGRHTLAANFGLDLGNQLDRDAELLVGAENALRGYGVRTFSGDKRLIINLEDRIHIYDDIAKIISLGAAAFIDIGGSTEDSPGELLGRNLFANAGIGLRLGFPRSSGGRIVRIDLALPLRGLEGETDAYEPRIILSAGQIFSSFFTSETNKNSPSVSSLYGISN